MTLRKQTKSVLTSVTNVHSEVQKSAVSLSKSLPEQSLSASRIEISAKDV